MIYRGALAVVYRIIAERLKSGGTASYPRVEVHSLSEGEPLDKGYQVRELEAVVESMSNASYGEAVQLDADAMSKIIGYTEEQDGVKVLGIMPGQLTELTETADTQAILYRQIHRIKIIAEWQNLEM